MTKKKPLLLYIHGFNSSPLSLKAQVMSEYCQKHRPDIKVLVPQMPCFPQQAAELLKQLIERYHSDYHMMSSTNL